VESVPIRVNIEHVDGEVVGRQLHLIKDLIKCHWLLIAIQTDHLIAVVFDLLLDETQQMFLIHARSCVDVSIDLSDVVEIAVGHGFLQRQFLQLVEQDVQLILGRQVRQSAVTKRFQGSIRDHDAHSLDVVQILPEDGIVAVETLSALQGVGVLVDVEDAVDAAD